MIHVPLPRTPTDMQIRIRRPIEHDPRARIPHIVREAMLLRVKRPENHIMRPDRDPGAPSIKGISIAVLDGAAEHVDQARSLVRGRGQLLHDADGPFQAHGIGAEGDVPEFVFVAREADPVVGALAERGRCAVWV